MNYLSVKEVAKKYNISERRVQQLCELGRFEGAKIIGGTYSIPEDADKPKDLRTDPSEANPDLISLKALCLTLSISLATGRNWIRLGKLIPQEKHDRSVFFTKEYADSIKGELTQSKDSPLKSRRNKKYVSGYNRYDSYISENSPAKQQVQKILDYVGSGKLSISDMEIATLVAECAVQFMLRDTLFPFAGNCLEAYLSGSLTLFGYEFLIDDLIEDKNASLTFIKNHPKLFNLSYHYDKNEDILGLLYISTKNLGTRKATGSYYTPDKIVNSLCDKLFSDIDPKRKTILDPCCGTGNFLLKLPSSISFKNIYGNDTDELSVKIARINLAIKYGIKDQKLLYAHITNEDYLNHSINKRFNIIIGNPPWGYEFSEEDKKRLKEKYLSAQGATVESYDVFIEQSLRDLSKGGILSFVLPEALLNVKSHTAIRKLISENCSFKYLNFLGNAFEKVSCPSIILELCNTGKSSGCVGMEVMDGRRNYVINVDRNVQADCFSFLTTDEEYAIINKISSHEGNYFLKDNASFALGIVTGDNKKYISKDKNDSNELVLKGCDIEKYHIKDVDNYISYKPEAFQQVAPERIYRAPEKLLYRFICDQLVFAYDNKQTLTLNSCNMLIPHIEGLSTKYILAVLNSRIAQFYFKKCFNSIKVLRQHIEMIPIPNGDKKQQDEVITFVDCIQNSNDRTDIKKWYDELDKRILALYGLTNDEYEIITASLKDENIFLKGNVVQADSEVKIV